MSQLLLFLIAANLQAGLITNDQIEIRFVPTETSRAVAVLVPVLGERLPEVRTDDECQWQFGTRMIAAGIEVVPLIIRSEKEVKLSINYNQSIDRVATKGGMAQIICPWHFKLHQEDGLRGYLIIVPDDFYDNILPLARWKERKGFKVWVKKTSETGTQRDQIRNFIREAYQNWSPKIEYVLLVGAINKIPAFPTPGATSCVTDHPYSLVDGEDFLSDLFVGRLPAANISELDCIVAKIIGYESNPYTEDTFWFKRALMVGTSYQEGGTPAVTALVTKRRIREKLLAKGFNIVDTVFYPPTASGRGPIDTSVNNGVLFINGRGWGQASGWNYPQFQISDVYNLNNGWKLPVITSLYCGTGNYQANPCFGEAWLRAGTPTAPKGGVGFWGASYTGTSTRWNNCMDYGIYQAIFDRSITTLGPAMYCGKLEQLINFPLRADSEDLVIYFHVYNLLGDPAMEMWTGVPQEIVVSYPSEYPVGTTSFSVNVRDAMGNPVENAQVCLFKLGEVQEVRRTDRAGFARFNISTTTADTMFVTVTGRNLKPHLGYSLGVIRGVFVGHLRHSPDTVNPGNLTNLSVVLKNYGLSQTANNTIAVLSALDSFCSVADSVRNYGSLAPGQEGTAEPFQISVAPSCTSGQRLPLRLRIASEDSIWYSGFTIDVHGPTFDGRRYTVYDQNGVLDPGESVEVAITVLNRGEGDANNVTGILRSANPAAIRVLDSTGYFGNIPSGDSAANTIDRFKVQVNAEVAIGHKFLLYLTLTGAEGFNQQISFSVTIGQPVSSTPFGPDRYGYYGYDDTDIGYQERPEFNWIEIDPNQGGQGTRITIGNDRAVEVQLPFTFRFYGQNYETISVCDNGYIAMGNTWFGDPYNWHIPSAQGPDGFVAVFWDDFRTDTLNAGGVYYFYDEPQHRFIVEWSNVYHIHGFRNPIVAEQQTFQAILFDPAYYQTLTGDGPIVCQYLFVQNDDTIWGNSHNFATVGIQSQNHDDGLEWTFAGMYPAPAAEIVPHRAIKWTTNPPDTFTFICEKEDAALPFTFKIFPSVATRGVWLDISRSPVFGLRSSVFDITGREVRQLTFSAGANNRLFWDLRDEKGKRVPAGVYILRLTDTLGNNKISVEKRVVVLR
ncbi:MAG: C25 family cysteine peptidase [candidate division WOR-3 bacterium]